MNAPVEFRRWFQVLSAFCLGLAFTALPVARAAQIDIRGPAGSSQFGKTVTVLPNGNVVVTDPLFDIPGSFANAGAVYLYDGLTLNVISTLTGGKANDEIGNGGVTVLSNGDYVVCSTLWDNGTVVNAGAATWCNGTTGVSGVVSATNSLVGSTAGDQVGNGGVVLLSNGNYLVRSTIWNNGAVVNVGAVTWGSSTTGVTGEVSAANSLVGSTANDNVGNSGVTPLNNGNYVVRSTVWNNGTVANAGAATWGNGTTGTTGVVSAVNSLVGGTANDNIGSSGVLILSNDNYVVRSPNWDNGAEVNAGAVTWGSGTTGATGVVSAANSLVGSTANDTVGSGGVTLLNNGNYVVRSGAWDNGAVVNAGAVTWGSGTTGVTGEVSAANSLIGSTASDTVGSGGVIALSNGNYLVSSPNWDNGVIANVGAVTWANGLTGLSGVISTANSLIGSTAGDTVGNNGVTVLGNGNYVVSSASWDNGLVPNVGAVTWGSGATGIFGSVSAANSLTGSTTNDAVGNGGVTALNNGNYVVSSLNWRSGAVVNVGAATWANGTTGLIGTVSAANSLIGSTANDLAGNGGVTALNNGNYVVSSLNWDNGAVINAGAITWGSGTSGVNGAISATNSLVGSSANDTIGNGGILGLSNGNYVVDSPNWNNGATANAGAVTWGSGTSGVNGAVSAANSLVGGTANDTVGNEGVTALNNGNYLVSSLSWNNGDTVNAGAMTWGSGTAGVSGAVSAANSLVGSTANDLVGSGGVTLLSNGNYVVASPDWDNGAVVNAGAATWGSGNTGVSGVVSATNSLVGSTADDIYDSTGGGDLVIALGDGNYVVNSLTWDNGELVDAGAITLGDGTLGVSGAVTAATGVLGTVAGGGATMSFAYDLLNTRLIVGYPDDNRVSIFGYNLTSYTVILIPISYTNGGFRFEVQGPTGPNYVILASTNLVNWSGLKTNLSPTTPFQYNDAGAGAAGHKFYRVRLQR